MMVVGDDDAPLNVATPVLTMIPPAAISVALRSVRRLRRSDRSFDGVLMVSAPCVAARGCELVFSR
jgi:hypothetical protein